MRMISPPHLPLDRIGKCILERYETSPKRRTFTDDLRLKILLFRETNRDLEGNVARLGKRVFCVFVLPLMLAHGIWSVADDDRAWYSNLRDEDFTPKPSVCVQNVTF